MDTHPEGKPPFKISIATVDMSLRCPGYCFMSRTGNVKSVDNYCALDNHAKDASSFGDGLSRKFKALELEAQGLHSLIEDFERRCEIYKPDYIFVEFPSFTQNAKSAVYIGMLWGAFRKYFNEDNFVAVEPTALKIWSGSKKGEGKDKVKEKVLSRIDGINTNHNIIDAVGLSLMFFDLVDDLRSN